MSILALQRPRLILISLSIEAIALGVYLVRDAFGGVIRYYTSIYHMNALWYVPDVIALLCLIQFFVHCILRNRSTLAFLAATLLIFTAVLLGTFFH